MMFHFIQKSHHIFSRQQNSILSAATLITGSSLLSALLGLWRNRLLISRFFGDPTLEMQLDAYWVAFRLPELVFQLLVIGSLSAAFIPVYSAYKEKKKGEANHIASSMMNLVLLTFFAFSVVIFTFAEQFNGLITSVNFTPEQVVLAAQLSRIMLLAQFFFAISNFLTGIIQAEQRFLIPALSPLAYNLGIIIGIIFLSPVIGIYGPAVGVVIGALLHLLLQLPLALKLGYRYSPVIDLSHKGVKEMITLIPPRTMAISVNQLELFASVYFATALAPGSLTILNIAQALMSAPTRIFSAPIGQASLPFLSKEVARGEMEQFKKTFISSLHHIFFLALPAGMLLLILRIPLVRLAYGAPGFPWAATLLTGRAVAIFSLALFAQGAILILVRAFYALHNTKIPFLIALVSVMINIGLSYLAVFVFEFGILGIAGAMSISTIIQFVLLFTLLIRHVGGIKLSLMIASPIKMLLASAAMGVGLWAPMRLLDRYVFDTTRVVPLILLTGIVGVIGAGVYFVLAYWFKIPEVQAYSHLLHKVGNWRQALRESGEVIEEPPTQAEEIKPL
jgi:putative peptidoglycan lipid II flippase